MRTHLRGSDIRTHTRQLLLTMFCTFSLCLECQGMQGHRQLGHTVPSQNVQNPVRSNAPCCDLKFVAFLCLQDLRNETSVSKCASVWQYIGVSVYWCVCVCVCVCVRAWWNYWFLVMNKWWRDLPACIFLFRLTGHTEPLPLRRFLNNLYK